jgi:putative ABC transport system permease protein
MSQVRGIMDQVSEALQIVFLFTLAAGIIVLLAAIQSTQEERLREGAILRTLGARRSQIWTGILAEFLTLGCLAGILATLGANLIAYLVANQVLNLEFRFHASWWWVALAAGTFGIGLAGSLGVYWSLRRTPMQLLARE